VNKIIYKHILIGIINFVLLLFAFSSCNSSKKEQYIHRTFFNSNNVAYKNQLQDILVQNNFEFPFYYPFKSQEKQVKNILQNLYQQLDFEFIWWDTLNHTIKNDEILKLFESLTDSGYQSPFHLHLLHHYKQNATIKDFESIIEWELALTATYISQGLEIAETTQKDEKIISWFIQNVKKQSLYTNFFTIEPQTIFYQQLITAYRQFLKHADISLAGIEKDEIKTHKLNFLRKYACADSICNNQSDSLILQFFCNQHGLFNKENFYGPCDEYLQWSNTYRIQKIKFSLKQIKETSIKDSIYVLLNIPAFQLFIVVNNTISDTFKVIVGKAETPTPTLYSHIYNINTYPEWNVPYSIASKEILPQLKKDSTYLVRKKYRAYTKNNQEINSTEINWKNYSAQNFPYRLVKEAGIHNDLGLIKIQFNNKYQVYMHDTPSRHLFTKDIRAFSHGCMRVENTFEFAAKILELGKNPVAADTLKMYAEKEMSRNISVKNQIPVYVCYFTSLGNANREIYFFKDLYQKETSK
jgi:hypothetical protein